MYWFYNRNLLDFALFLLLSCGWAFGGVLLVRSVFKLHRIDRILTGLAAGFVLFIGLSNLIANLLPLTQAFWLASLLILFCGIMFAWRSPGKVRLTKKIAFLYRCLLACLPRPSYSP